MEDTMNTTVLQARSLMPALTVNDLKRSLQFYRDGLGFKVTEEMNEKGEIQGVMLDAGGATLGLSQDDFGKGRDRTKGVGMRFYLETDQDIDALAGQAKAAGITLSDGPGPLPWGPVGFTVTDPDGFKLTISKPS
jgi:lactoylglutathione lyase